MEDRKKSHIDLTFNSQSDPGERDSRFYYEPVMGKHPDLSPSDFTFLHKKFSVPLWISSMTGGTRLAQSINRNLARACGEFGLGMGLGSCRILLEDDSHFPDFDVRDLVGEEHALYANLGISQIELLLENNKVSLLTEMIKKLRADGLIIHINPLQEWIQPEGDPVRYLPVETLEKILEKVTFRVIVKEVGQGMGPESLRRLLKLPLEAIEFAAFGGTNFAKLELQRRPDKEKEFFESLINIGEDAESMVGYANHIFRTEKDLHCNQLIISGGIKDYLDGYYLVNKSLIPAIYGQASQIIKYAREDYDMLASWLESQIKGYKLAETFLRVKE